MAPSQAPEFKSKHLLAPARRDALLWLLGPDGPLVGNASVYLVDKDYFVVGKVVDLLVEELTHERGEDLYGSMRARDMAWALHREGARALGGPAWQGLLGAFNSLMRAKQRSGDKTTVDAFFDEVDRVRLNSTRRRVTEALDLVWQARPHANAFQEGLVESPETLPALDPLVASLAQTVRTWAGPSRRPVRVVHDEQAMLTPERVLDFRMQLARPHPDFERYTERVNVVSVDLVRSEDDPRVMLADLLAGVARVAATGALIRSPDTVLVDALRPYVDVWSLWSDPPSWTALTGRPQPGA
jgi:hypothetical protein